MTRPATREIVEVLGAFLRRNNAALSDDEIRSQMENIAEGRVHTPDSIRPFVVPSNATTRSLFPDDAVAAADLPPRDVRERLAHLADYVAAQVTAGELPRIDLPDLHRANGIFDARGNVFVGDKVRRLAFDDQGSDSFMRLLLTLEAATDNLRNDVCTTKRGLFYRHRATLPDSEQRDTDRALASLANVLRVRRKALGFVESPKGSVYGRLVIRDGGVVVDLSRVAGGRLIPRFTDDVEIISSDAVVIVIVEKESIATKLAQARWCESTRSIMVCGSGFPAISTREFVRKLTDTLGIRTVVCADADAAGIQLALTYAHGSISTALETPWLACNDLWWAGLYPSDIDRHCRSTDLIQLYEADLEKARKLLEHPSRTYLNDRVREELAILVDRRSKVELDTLTHDTSRLVDILKHKLEADLIKL